MLQLFEPETADGAIGARITGIDVRTLRPESDEIGLIREKIYTHKLVTLCNQQLTPQTYVEFCRKLGRPQIYFQTNYHHPEHPEIFVSSNVNRPGEKVGVAGTGRYWHTDCSFEPKPLSFTSIVPVVFPQTKRETYYINMAQVWRDMPERLKARVRDATAIHQGQLRYKVQACDIDLSLAELLERIDIEVPPVCHPAVIRHPITGDEILYLNSGFTTKLEGLTYEENRRVLGELFAFIELEEHVHTHRWEEGDLIIWDNRYLIHKASTLPNNEKSKSYRIGIYDGQPFYRGLEP